MDGRLNRRMETAFSNSNFSRSFGGDLKLKIEELVFYFLNKIKQNHYN